VSHAISPSPANPASVSVAVPDPGDNRTAASVVTPFTSIWSGVLWLYGVITGAIPANLTIDGALNVLADTYITGQLNSGKIVSTGDILGNGDLAAPGSASIGGHLTAATLDIPAGGYIDASGAGCAAYLPPTTMYGPLSFGSTGRVIPRVTKLAATVGMTASPKTATHYFYSSAAAASSATIDDTDTQDGDEIWFTNASTLNTVTIKTPAGAAIDFVGDVGTNKRTIQVMRIAGTWQAVIKVPR
jgi:hypothetical protein